MESDKCLLPESLRLPCSSMDYGQVIAFADTAAGCAGFNDVMSRRLRMAIEEAVVNVHSYSGATFVTLDASICNRQLAITITDDGRPFNPTAHDKPDLSVSADKRPPGGLGIFYMRKMSSSMEYCRKASVNILTMKFNLTSAATVITGGRFFC